MKKNEENAKITVQDWLDYLKSEKQNILSSEQALTPRTIGTVTLFISSLVTYFQFVGITRVLSEIGIICSICLFFVIGKKYADNMKNVDFLKGIQEDILEGKFQKVEEIDIKYKISDINYNIYIRPGNVIIWVIIIFILSISLLVAIFQNNVVLGGVSIVLLIFGLLFVITNWREWSEAKLLKLHIKELENQQN